MKIIETEQPKEDAGQSLTDALREHSKKPILLMVSGGSAFSLLDFVEPSVLGPHITLTVLDERFSSDPAINNFTQLEQTKFFASCINKRVQTISTKVLEYESLHGLHNRFDTALHTWKEQNEDGVIIATMGIGPDGHTAGIFPGEHGVDFNDNTWVVGYTVPKEVNQYPERVTVTNTFLRNKVDQAIVYAVGSDKYRLIQKLQATETSIQEIPATIFKEMPFLIIFTHS
ncbi:hypothetical protein COZ82_00525 [Candidatus Kaiserbacteria bacterium CG_4_8_14_3_um_filter_38_9]|uniref:Glucosamine/galactosamine-6-phosphate isomerase domain-containing protein n=1 Tax=Candidatus Kaiserbacteria bacterium CG_4_8_14_3_um_filter_38_9 TaxID=1974599 RepID=A0A2M7IPM3_9BACT|nr:MAG: hypothetical protein COZ82_00525 [Candidatus Kaiserbacteria bacterium CG_4_8_14_3_um_filter_38_9]